MEIKDKINDKDIPVSSKLSARQREFLTSLRENVRIDDKNITEWRDKQIISSNQRLGIKRYSEDPYPGAPDIPLPETDKIIKKRIPAKVLSSFMPKKLATIKLEDGKELTDTIKEKIRKSEKYLNASLRKKEVNLFRKLMLAADNSEQYGHCIFRVYEDFDIKIDRDIINLDKEYTEDQLAQFDLLSEPEKEQYIADKLRLDLEDDSDTISDILKQYHSGERKIEFTRKNIKTFANINTELPTKITVPEYTTDMETANRIKREEYWTRVELDTYMDAGIFYKKDLDTLKISTNTDTDTNEQQKAMNEGVTDNASDSELYKIDIINTWYKDKESGYWQKWIFVFLSDVSDVETSLLQSIPFPFSFDGWDYVKHDNELKDPRYYDSRGVPEQIRAYQEFMERAVNNILIRDEINNMPMYEILDTSDIMDSHVRLRPGAKLPVQQIGTEINPLNTASKVDIQSERVIQLLKGFTEEYMGSNDQLFRSSTNAGGGKTLGEIQAGLSHNATLLQLEIVSWHESLSRLYQKFFELLRDRMIEPVYIGNEVITPDDLDFDAVVLSNGSIELSDQEQATRKSLQRMIMVERFMQNGIADLNDYFNSAQEWLERDGVRDAMQFITNPEDIAKSKISQMQQYAKQMSEAIQRGQEELDKLQKSIARNQVKIQKDLNNYEGKVIGKLEVGKDKSVSITRKEEING